MLTCVATFAYALATCDSSSEMQLLHLNERELEIEPRLNFSRITPHGFHLKKFWSGRGDSNSRSPAPKAGALATTLRPEAQSESLDQISYSAPITDPVPLAPKTLAPAGVAQW